MLDQNAMQPLAVAAVTYYVTEASKRLPLAGLSHYRAGFSRTVAALVSVLGTWGIIVTCQGSAGSGFDCHATVPPVVDLARFATQAIATFFLSKLGWEISRPKG